VGGFDRGGVGRAGEHAIRSEIRGDSIRWISGEPATEARERYFTAIEELRLYLNRELYLGLRSFEAQYAVFPPGACYKKHVDRFSSSDERTISCLLYLNADWSEGDGGALRLHLGGGPLDILPRGGTVVVFRSELVEHEVLPARRERFSLTGWFRQGSLQDVMRN